jgi:hypothetical protein
MCYLVNSEERCRVDDRRMDKRGLKMIEHKTVIKYDNCDKKRQGEHDIHYRFCTAFTSPPLRLPLWTLNIPQVILPAQQSAADLRT